MQATNIDVRQPGSEPAPTTADQLTAERTQAVTPSGLAVGSPSLPVFAPRPPQEELYWRQYALFADLLKNYIDLVIKFNTYYYTAIAGIVGLFVAISPEKRLLARYFLPVPILLSFMFAVVSFYASKSTRALRYENERIGRALSLSVVPDVSVLAFMLLISGVLFASVAVAIVVGLVLSLTARI